MSDASPRLDSFGRRKERREAIGSGHPMGQTDASGCRLGSSSLRGKSTSLSLERNQAPATLARVQLRAARTQSAERCRGRAISSVQRTHVHVEVIPKESSKRALVVVPIVATRKAGRSRFSESSRRETSRSQRCGSARWPSAIPSIDSPRPEFEFRTLLDEIRGRARYGPI